MRQFSNGNLGNILRSAAGPAEPHANVVSNSPEQMEAMVRKTRQTFGETLPKEFLTSEEYRIYERLYGPPTHETRPEDVKLLQMLEEDSTADENNMIDDENNMIDDEADIIDNEADIIDNEADIIDDEADTIYDETQGESELEQSEYEDPEELEGVATETDGSIEGETDREFKARVMLNKDIAAAYKAAKLIETEATDSIEEVEEVEDEYVPSEENDQDYGERRDLNDIDDSNSGYPNSEASRAHPFTIAGRFDTFPATLQIPKKTLDPINAVLADAANKHLSEVAQKTFGGRLLPSSTATPTGKGYLKQQPIALHATQFRMGEMEANAYLAAITPGIYTSVTSALVEIRKRLGPEWIRDLLRNRRGPSILEVGGAGAGVLAWRDLLHAEWELLHPDGVPGDKFLPVGRATVVIGSEPLRSRMSQMLDNVIFLPRLPVYQPALDHPSAEDQGTTSKKSYDIIIAPHSLWRHREDYQRKNQVQHFWSMLNPKGGVLLLIEKGLPRGFELIASAREVLLKHHIASPGSEMIENRVADPFHARSREKETGMIIAPCTNHLKCPMYLTSGQTTGRKDHCHFSQRYLRPPFLQRILGAKNRNHEDIRFSYVAVQRGIDRRQTSGILQGEEATNAAFQGYETEEPQDTGPSNELSPLAESSVPEFHPLSLPRAILPPLKRRGHVILDLCTPSGQVERWTVPRSFSKQAYRDARKSKWGDLWPLGAKCRGLKNLRLGTKGPIAKTEHMEHMSDLNEDDNIINGLGTRKKQRKKKIKHHRDAQG